MKENIESFIEEKKYIFGFIGTILIILVSIFNLIMGSFIIINIVTLTICLAYSVKYGIILFGNTAGNSPGITA